MAPRDDAQTVAWREAKAVATNSDLEDALGCVLADHIGFYSILTAAAAAGLAACLMYVNSGGSAHILSAAGAWH